MSRVSDIIKELNKLPDGYISYKIIKGKKYSYFQYVENNKLQSKYVKKQDLPDLLNAIKRRKLLEKELKELQTSGKNLPILSENARKLTGSIMLEDTVVAVYENGQLISKDEKLCPLLINKTHDVVRFLAGRAIDKTRTNARLLKKALQIHETEDELIALYSYGATITDNYWFKPKKSKIKYKDISFDGDFYSDLALTGELIVLPRTPRLTPQLTTPGSYEKCWRKVDGKWWLYKKGNENEIFSELFCSLLAKELNIPTAIYEQSENFIRTLNFADKYNFEPISSIALDDDSYENVFNSIIKFGEDLAKQYLLLVWYDCLINNIDRHNENCGLLRNKKTGKIVSLAPNFDNNLALISRSEVLNINTKNDGFINIFISFLKQNSKAYALFKQIELPILDRETIKRCFDQITIKKDEDTISKYLINRYNIVSNIK